ncbi:sugar-binding transcriptional regulator [Vibrio albus]|nr:sugar-binding transcriptional regulator [Vibrio albus]
MDNYAKSEQIIRAAWMYFILGKNQNEIAAELGVSRPVVQRLIAAAKDEGAVSVSINHPIATCLNYSELVKEKFSLERCHIVPENQDESVLNSVAYGGAQIMSEYINHQNTHIIGIGSGNTLKRVVSYLDPMEHSDKKCVSLISAMAVDGQCNYYDDVPLILASRIKANYYQLPAPRYSRSAEAYDLWCQNPLYQDITAIADTANVTFIGIGSVIDGGNSPIIADGFISDQQAGELTEQGAVGEILGTFVDIEGNVLDHVINQRNTSYNVRRNPNLRVGIAGGAEKRKTILAALQGKWINGLVTDEATAKWLLVR